MHVPIANPMPGARTQLHHLRLLGAQLVSLNLKSPEVLGPIVTSWVGSTLNRHGIFRADQVSEEMLSTLSERAAFEAHFAAAWARCGFPLIAPAHRLAASLMWTVAPPSSLADVRTPWPCFAISVPENLLTWRDRYDCTVAASHLLVLAGETKITVVAEAHPLATQRMMLTTVIHDTGTSLAELGEASDAYDTSPSLTSEGASATSRGITAARRLVLGSVLELERSGESTARPAAPAQGGKRTRPTEPRAWTFKLTRDVAVDARDALHDYLSSGHGSPHKVQSLVRGHWQRYATGEGRQRREWRHKEPYWKGPEDAPIAARAHRVL